MGEPWPRQIGSKLIVLLPPVVFSEILQEIHTLLGGQTFAKPATSVSTVG